MFEILFKNGDKILVDFFEPDLSYEKIGEEIFEIGVYKTNLGDYQQNEVEQIVQV